MNNEKQRSVEKIAVLFSELQKELFNLTGSELFEPNSNKIISLTFKDKTYSLLAKLGIPSSLFGYEMIAFALNYLHTKNRKVFYTKELYPTIASAFSTTATAVERDMRHAILFACQKGNTELLKTLFPFNFSEDGIPNSIFLPGILEYLKTC